MRMYLLWVPREAAVLAESYLPDFSFYGISSGAAGPDGKPDVLSYDFDHLDYGEDLRENFEELLRQNTNFPFDIWQDPIEDPYELSFGSMFYHRPGQEDAMIEDTEDSDAVSRPMSISSIQEASMAYNASHMLSDTQLHRVAIQAAQSRLQKGKGGDFTNTQSFAACSSLEKLFLKSYPLPASCCIEPTAPTIEEQAESLLTAAIACLREGWSADEVQQVIQTFAYHTAEPVLYAKNVCQVAQKKAFQV